MFRVIDTRTGEQIAEFCDRFSADNLADKLDAGFGAVRYVVQIVGRELTAAERATSERIRKAVLGRGKNRKRVVIERY